MAPILYFLLSLYVFTRAIVACSSVTQSHETSSTDAEVALADPCAGGFDDTALVQTRMSNGQCLPPGVYNIDAPPLGANGRRRDAMLTGSLCGAGAALTTVRFRGDAHALYWLGVYLPAHSSVHDLTLQSCLSNTLEQTHLLHTGVGSDAVDIHDNVFIHPAPADGSKSGDCVNVVGSATAPNAGMTVSHNVFQSCKRVGIQVSRGLSNAVINDNTFTGCGEDIGTEGGGAIANLTISHNAFSSSLTSGYALALEHIDGLVFDHNQVQGRPMLLYFVDHAQLGYSAMTNRVPSSPVIRIGDTAHHIAMTSMLLSQASPSASPVVTAAPLDTNRQADLADITIASSEMDQSTGQPFVILMGVTAMSLTDSTLDYTGPASFSTVSIVAGTSGGVSPATPVASTGVTESGTTRIGF